MTSALLDHYLWVWVLGIGVFFFCSQWVRPRFGLAASLLLACVSYSSLWTWAWAGNRYATVNPYDQMALRLFAGDSLLKLLLLVVPLMVWSKNRWGMRLVGEVCCSMFVIGNSLYALGQALHGCADNRCGGLLGNPSISLGFMACLLPLVVQSLRHQWWIILMAGAAAVFSGSSVALGMFGVYLAFALWQSRKMWWLGAGALLGFLGLGRLAFGAELLNDSDRFMIWKYMFHAWNAPSNWFQGSGLGTYHVISVNLQNGWGRSVAGRMWWNTLHNDWLQMLFECGAVGLVLLLFTYGAALAKLWRERDFQFFASLLMFGVYMGLDPALHDPIPCLFGAWALIYALRKTKLKEYP